MSTLKYMYAGISKIYSCVAVVLIILVFFNVTNMMFPSKPRRSLHNVISSLETRTASSLNYLKKQSLSLGDIMVKRMNTTALSKQSSGTSRNIHKVMKDIKPNNTDQVVNPHPFRYLLNPVNFCSKKDIFIITYVHSSPAHLKKREAVRKTWGSEQYVLNRHVKVVFIMGQDKNNAVMRLVRKESDRFGDIVQEDFDDSYRNLTYKAIAGLKWVSTFCRHAKYVLKTDDDIFVNMYILVKYINTSIEPSNRKTEVILCFVQQQMPVIRNKKSKWNVLKKEFSPDTFPAYCSGSAYLLSSDVPEKLVETSFNTPFFWVDDYYITGALVHKLHIPLRGYNRGYYFYNNVYNFTKEKLASYTFLHIRPQTMLYVWNTLNSQKP